MSHGYAMLPKYRGQAVCRCGECRRCKNREAVYRYRESRNPLAAEEYARIDRALSGPHFLRSGLSPAGHGASESVSGEVAAGSL
jgi:hypothetical protein